MIDAIFIGPMKTGTTWIYDYLKSRRDVNLPTGVKETFFFDKNFAKGYNWYASHFKDTKDELLNIEVAPSYFHSKEAPSRINDYSCKDINIIISLRNPVQRSYSHYLHLLRYGFTSKNLKEAIKEYPEILNASKYGTCMEHWLNYFERDALTVLELETLKKNPIVFTQNLCRGLNITYKKIPENLKDSKSNAAKVPISSGLASIGQWTADFLRDKKLYAPVNYAKRLGLKKVFFGNPLSSEKPNIKREEEIFLMEKLNQEIDKLSSLMNQDFNEWKF